jgi:hypothetical protein
MSCDLASRKQAWGFVRLGSSLWEKLPADFLKKNYRAWCQLDGEVQLLIVELAGEQYFKCAFCSRTRGLIIEHDHDPDEGPGDRYTIYNIRGLVCQRCNWHIGIYETDQRGDYRGWDNVSSSDISDGQYEDYIYAYGGRLRQLREDELKRTCPNYWARRLVIDKFDGWREWGREYPWVWGFEEIKEKRHGKIRTPMQFIRTLAACVNFLREQIEKDPNFRPSEQILKNLTQIKSFMDRIRPVVEARLTELGYRRSDVNRSRSPRSWNIV